MKTNIKLKCLHLSSILDFKIDYMNIISQINAKAICITYLSNNIHLLQEWK